MKANNLKFALLCLIIISSISHSYGQVKFGVKSGINIATTKDLIAYPKNRIGWYAGVFTQIPINKNLFLQPELLYSSKGHGSYNQVGRSEIDTRINYLNLPVLLGYKIKNKASFFIGPEFGYLTTVHLYYSEGGDIDVTKNYPPRIDIGLNIGIKYKITRDLGVEARYNYGFRTLYSVDAAGNRNSDNKGSNRVFQIGFNYIFSQHL